MRRGVFRACGSRGRAGLLAAAVLSVLNVSGPAGADLKVCNATSGRAGFALGYQDPNGWTTEGWWNIAAETCETLLRGAVPSRYIYIYAVDYDHGGEWSGKTVMCIEDKSFAIRGTGDCEERGLRPAGFIEIDTGESRDWTIRLTDPEEEDTPIR